MLTLASCSGIEESERFVYAPVEAKRIVLLEDFTGQKCVNCPEAHQTIERLMEQHPDSIVAVSIHGGGMSINKSETDFDSKSNRIGLGTDEGQVYNDKYGIDSWPAGVINRNSGVLDRDKWAKYIDEELKRPTDVDLNLAAHIENNEVKIDLTIKPQADIQGMLNVWLLESGIVARQLEKSGKWNNEYVHNHVFRAPVTPADGKSVTLTKDISMNAQYSIALRYNDQERWNPANLSVVAFITNSEDNDVFQAVQADVATAEDTPEADPTPEN